MTPFRARRSDLLPRDAAGETWLTGVVAILCLLACLAAVAAMASSRAAQGWSGELGVQATVQVRPRVGETGPTAAARAAETLASVDGVAEAVALDRDAAEDLLRPWMGETALADLPIPFLVTVVLDDQAPASAVTLSRALAEAGLDASVDDHGQWRRDIERSALMISGLAALAFLMTALGAAAAVVYATRAILAARRDVIDILRSAGATDRQVANLFRVRMGVMAVQAGALATAVALALTAGLRLVVGSDGPVAALPVTWSDLGPLLLCPPIAGLVAVAAASVAGRSSLGGAFKRR